MLWSKNHPHPHPVVFYVKFYSPVSYLVFLSLHHQKKKLPHVRKEKRKECIFLIKAKKRITQKYKYKDVNLIKQGVLRVRVDAVPLTQLARVSLFYYATS